MDSVIKTDLAASKAPKTTHTTRLDRFKLSLTKKMRRLMKDIKAGKGGSFMPLNSSGGTRVGRKLRLSDKEL